MRKRKEPIMAFSSDDHEHHSTLNLHPVRSAEELHAALAFAQRLLGFSADHRGGFVDYYLSRYLRHPEYGQLQSIAEEQGTIHAVVLGSVQDDHILIGEVAVAEAYRGQGIASRLLKMVEQQSRIPVYQGI